MNKTRRPFMFRWLTISYAALLLGGCAAPSKSDTRIVWPAPPNPPRLEWVGTYASLDQMPPGTSVAQVGKFLLGGQPKLVFKRPFGIAATGDGRVFVSDADERRITVYDFEKRAVYPFSRTDAVRAPFGLALDSRGRLFAVDAESKTVLVFGPDDAPLFAFGGPEVLEHPVFLALDEARNKIYVSDARGHRIVVFDLGGKYLKSFGQWGARDGSFYSPQGLAVDKTGNLYVADMFNARIQVFDAEGKFLRKFGKRGDLQSNFEMPKGLAIDSDGNLHITDARKGALLCYSPEGQPLLFLGGGKSSHPLDLLLPAGIWIDRNDRIYVVDQLSRRFVIWQYLSKTHARSHPNN